MVTLGDVLLAGFFALAMTRFRLSARTCSVVFGLTSVTVEFMVLLRIGEAPLAEPASSGRVFCCVRTPQPVCSPFSGMRRSGGYEAFCFEYQPAILALKWRG